MNLPADELRRIVKSYPSLSDVDERELRNAISDAILSMASSRNFLNTIAALHLMVQNDWRSHRIEAARRSTAKIFDRFERFTKDEKKIMRFLLHNAKQRERKDVLWKRFLAKAAANEKVIKRRTAGRRYKKLFYAICRSRYLSSMQLVRELKCPRIILPRHVVNGRDPRWDGHSTPLNPRVEEEM